MAQIGIKKLMDYGVPLSAGRRVYEVKREGCSSQLPGVILMRTLIEWMWEIFPLNFLKKSRFPFRERPFLILPAAHFFMGGVEIDESCRTKIPGLFACGEIVWGIHGANRLGGNELIECLVCGSISGQSAAKYALTKELYLSSYMKRKLEKDLKEYLEKRRQVFDRPRDILNELRNLA